MQEFRGVEVAWIERDLVDWSILKILRGLVLSMGIH